MIFRNIDGLLVELKKNDFINDKLFYEKLKELKLPFSKLNKTNIIKKNYSTNIINNLIPETSYYKKN